MNKPEELIQKLQLIIQKAHRSLDVAKMLAQEGNDDFASSRAYYAVFYGIQAALLTKNLAASKHSGTIHLFGQYFIKTGIFPKEFNKIISHLYRHRQTGDYTFGPQIDHATATQDIQTAATVLQAIVAYLVKEGFLPQE
jgi:uncharacterized protein (UPF0332 family)